MKTRRVFFSEIAYVIGILTLAMGTALMERADFGISMVVAPAYLLHLKISQLFTAYTFGMSEYIFQAAVLVMLSIVMGRFKKSYLFSFITAVIYGLMLDLWIGIIAKIPYFSIAWRAAYYILGMIICAAGVALLFNTYIAPEAYELFVKETAAKYNIPIDKVKTVYDCASCLFGIVLSFCFFGFGRFEGVKLGTVFCALVNGWMIGKISGMLDRCFEFKDGLPYRKLFDK